MYGRMRYLNIWISLGELNNEDEVLKKRHVQLGKISELEYAMKIS